MHSISRITRAVLGTKYRAESKPLVEESSLGPVACGIWMSGSLLSVPFEAGRLDVDAAQRHFTSLHTLFHLL